MSMGRGSVVVVMGLILSLVFPFEKVDATSFTVGDSKGWSFYTEGWPGVETYFMVGDVLG